MAIKGRKKKTHSPRQMVWDYMRRNRASFKVSDILMLTPIMIDQLRRYFQALELAGYIKVIEEKSFKDSIYKLVIIKGVLAPVAKHNEHLLIDHNSKEEIDIRRYPIYLKVQKRIVSLSVDGNEIRINNMDDCGGRTTVKKELSKLTDMGILTIIKREWRGYVYSADIERLEALISEEEEKRCLNTC